MSICELLFPSKCQGNKTLHFTWCHWGWVKEVYWWLEGPAWSFATRNRHYSPRDTASLSGLNLVYICLNSSEYNDWQIVLETLLECTLPWQHPTFTSAELSMGTAERWAENHHLLRIQCRVKLIEIAEGLFLPFYKIVLWFSCFFPNEHGLKKVLQTLFKYEAELRRCCPVALYIEMQIWMMLCLERNPCTQREWNHPKQEREVKPLHSEKTHP